MTAVDASVTQALRVVLVDDSEDIRLLLHTQFENDDRFEVVGEAADGFEAVAVARDEQPDLLVLDQQMPGRTGLDAIAEIRRRAPATAIILYTADADQGVYQAAYDAGALDVLEKIALADGFVDRIVDTLVDRASGDDAMMDIHVGPVASSAARAWIANTSIVLAAVAEHPELIGTEIPSDVMKTYRSFMDQWDGMAATTDELRLLVRSSASDIYRLAHYWGVIETLTDEQIASLGAHRAAPEGEPFFEALTSGVLDALQRREETKRLAQRLGAQWERPVKR
jgi:DNA-binding NarL/FixJ family response regulator